MSSIINLIDPAYNLIRGRVDDENAKIIAEKLVLEIVKISTATGGYFAVTLLMSVMATPIQACVVGVVVLGATHAMTSRVSVILHDTTRITIGFIILKKGFVDLAVEPFIQAIKAGAGFAPVAQKAPVVIGTQSVPKTLFKALGIPFLKFIAGMTSLSAGGAFILDSVNQTNQDDERDEYKHVVDQAIFRVVKSTASVLIKIRGYRDTD